MEVRNPIIGADMPDPDLLRVGDTLSLIHIYMWHRKLWYRLVVATMYFNAGIIPWYMTMRNLHLTNNFWGYIFPAVVSPFYIILTKTFVESVPKELQEAAQKMCIRDSLCFFQKCNGFQNVRRRSCKRKALFFPINQHGQALQYKRFVIY